MSLNATPRDIRSKGMILGGLLGLFFVIFLIVFLKPIQSTTFETAQAFSNKILCDIHEVHPNNTYFRTESHSRLIQHHLRITHERFASTVKLCHKLEDPQETHHAFESITAKKCDGHPNVHLLSGETSLPRVSGALQHNYEYVTSSIDPSMSSNNSYGGGNIFPCGQYYSVDSRQPGFSVDAAAELNAISEAYNGVPIEGFNYSLAGESKQNDFSAYLSTVSLGRGVPIKNEGNHFVTYSAHSYFPDYGGSTYADATIVHGTAGVDRSISYMDVTVFLNFDEGGLTSAEEPAASLGNNNNILIDPTRKVKSYSAWSSLVKTDAYRVGEQLKDKIDRRGSTLLSKVSNINNFNETVGIAGNMGTHGVIGPKSASEGDFVPFSTDWQFRVSHLVSYDYPEKNVELYLHSLGTLQKAKILLDENPQVRGAREPHFKQNFHYNPQTLYPIVFGNYEAVNRLAKEPTKVSISYSGEYQGDLLGSRVYDHTEYPNLSKIKKNNYDAHELYSCKMVPFLVATLFGGEQTHGYFKCPGNTQCPQISNFNIHVPPTHCGSRILNIDFIAKLQDNFYDIINKLSPPAPGQTRETEDKSTVFVETSAYLSFVMTYLSEWSKIYFETATDNEKYIFNELKGVLFGTHSKPLLRINSSHLTHIHQMFVDAAPDTNVDKSLREWMSLIIGAILNQRVYTGTELRDLLVGIVGEAAINGGFLVTYYNNLDVPAQLFLSRILISDVISHLRDLNQTQNLPDDFSDPGVHKLKNSSPAIKLFYIVYYFMRAPGGRLVEEYYDLNLGIDYSSSEEFVNIIEDVFEVIFDRLSTTKQRVYSTQLITRLWAQTESTGFEYRGAFRRAAMAQGINFTEINSGLPNINRYAQMSTQLVFDFIIHSLCESVRSQIDPSNRTLQKVHWIFDDLWRTNYSEVSEEDLSIGYGMGDYVKLCMWVRLQSKQYMGVGELERLYELLLELFNFLRDQNITGVPQIISDILDTELDATASPPSSDEFSYRGLYLIILSNLAGGGSGNLAFENGVLEWLDLQDNTLLSDTLPQVTQTKYILYGELIGQDYADQYARLLSSSGNPLQFLPDITPSSDSRTGDQFLSQLNYIRLIGQRVGGFIANWATHQIRNKTMEEHLYTSLGFEDGSDPRFISIYNHLIINAILANARPSRAGGAIGPRGFAMFTYSLYPGALENRVFSTYNQIHNNLPGFTFYMFSKLLLDGPYYVSETIPFPSAQTIYNYVWTRLSGFNQFGPSHDSIKNRRDIIGPGIWLGPQPTWELTDLNPVDSIDTNLFVTGYLNLYQKLYLDTYSNLPNLTIGDYWNSSRTPLASVYLNRVDEVPAFQTDKHLLDEFVTDYNYSRLDTPELILTFTHNLMCLIETERPPTAEDPTSYRRSIKDFGSRDLCIEPLWDEDTLWREGKKYVGGSQCSSHKYSAFNVNYLGAANHSSFSVLKETFSRGCELKYGYYFSTISTDFERFDQCSDWLMSFNGGYYGAERDPSNPPSAGIKILDEIYGACLLDEPLNKDVVFNTFSNLPEFQSMNSLVPLPHLFQQTQRSALLTDNLLQRMGIIHHGGQYIATTPLSNTIRGRLNRLGNGMGPREVINVLKTLSINFKYLQYQLEQYINEYVSSSIDLDNKLRNISSPPYSIVVDDLHFYNKVSFYAFNETDNLNLIYSEPQRLPSGIYSDTPVEDALLNLQVNYPSFFSSYVYTRLEAFMRSSGMPLKTILKIFGAIDNWVLNTETELFGATTPFFLGYIQESFFYNHYCSNVPGTISTVYDSNITKFIYEYNEGLAFASGLDSSGGHQWRRAYHELVTSYIALSRDVFINGVSVRGAPGVVQTPDIIELVFSTIQTILTQIQLLDASEGSARLFQAVRRINPPAESILETYIILLELRSLKLAINPQGTVTPIETASYEMLKNSWLFTYYMGGKIEIRKALFGQGFGSVFLQPDYLRTRFFQFYQSEYTNPSNPPFLSVFKISGHNTANQELYDFAVTASPDFYAHIDLISPFESPNLIQHYNNKLQWFFGIDPQQLVLDARTPTHATVYPTEEVLSVGLFGLDLNDPNNTFTSGNMSFWSYYFTRINHYIGGTDYYKFIRGTFKSFIRRSQATGYNRDIVFDRLLDFSDEMRDHYITDYSPLVAEVDIYEQYVLEFMRSMGYPSELCQTLWARTSQLELHGSVILFHTQFVNWLLFEYILSWDDPGIFGNLFEKSSLDPDLVIGDSQVFATRGGSTVTRSLYWFTLMNKSSWDVIENFLIFITSPRCYNAEWWCSELSKPALTRDFLDFDIFGGVSQSDPYKLNWWATYIWVEDTFETSVGAYVPSGRYQNRLVGDSAPATEVLRYRSILLNRWILAHMTLVKSDSARYGEILKTIDDFHMATPVLLNYHQTASGDMVYSSINNNTKSQLISPAFSLDVGVQDLINVDKTKYFQSSTLLGRTDLPETDIFKYEYIGNKHRALEVDLYFTIDNPSRLMKSIFDLYYSSIYDIFVMYFEQTAFKEFISKCDQLYGFIMNNLFSSSLPISQSLSTRIHDLIFLEKGLLYRILTHYNDSGLPWNNYYNLFIVQGLYDLINFYSVPQRMPVPNFIRGDFINLSTEDHDRLRVLVNEDWDHAFDSKSNFFIGLVYYLFHAKHALFLGRIETQKRQAAGVMAQYLPAYIAILDSSIKEFRRSYILYSIIHTFYADPDFGLTDADCELDDSMFNRSYMEVINSTSSGVNQEDYSFDFSIVRSVLTYTSILEGFNKFVNTFNKLFDFDGAGLRAFKLFSFRYYISKNWQKSLNLMFDGLYTHSSSITSNTYTPGEIQSIIQDLQNNSIKLYTSHFIENEKLLIEEVIRISLIKYITTHSLNFDVSHFFGLGFSQSADIIRLSFDENIDLSVLISLLYNLRTTFELTPQSNTKKVIFWKLFNDIINGDYSFVISYTTFYTHITRRSITSPIAAYAGVYTSLDGPYFDVSDSFLIDYLIPRFVDLHVMNVAFINNLFEHTKLYSKFTLTVQEQQNLLTLILNSTKSDQEKISFILFMFPVLNSRVQLGVSLSPYEAGTKLINAILYDQRSVLNHTVTNLSDGANSILAYFSIYLLDYAPEIVLSNYYHACLVPSIQQNTFAHVKSLFITHDSQVRTAHPELNLYAVSINYSHRFTSFLVRYLFNKLEHNISGLNVAFGGGA